MKKSIDLYGNLTIDVVDGSIRPGGPGFYASRILSAIAGVRAYIHTCIPRNCYEYFQKLLERHNAVIVPTFGESMTIFVHREFDGLRVSKLIQACREDISVIPKSSIAIVSPVAGELTYTDMMDIMKSYSMVGVDIQGFVRDVDASRRVLTIPRLLHLHLIDRCSTKLIVKASLEEADTHLVEILVLKGAMVLITNGPRGAVLVTKKDITAARPRIIASSSIGAGDMFLALFTYTTSLGYDPHLALKVAVALTSIALYKGVKGIELRTVLNSLDNYVEYRKLNNLNEVYAFLS